MAMKEKQYLLDMKKVLSNSEKQIFKDLYESVNGLYAYTFYSRYKMSPRLMFEFIEKYKNILIFKDGKLSLTNEGRDVAVCYTNSTLKPAKNKYGRIPTEFIDFKLEINSLYLPNIDNI